MASDQNAPTTEKCPSCGAIIDTTEADPLSRIPCPQCGEKVRVQRSFNNFELVETLGIGGMGTVYKARDSLLDRFVALKLLRKDLGDEIDYATRLQQEARVAASVNHPNVIGVFSSGKDHGQFYLVMELVDKGSLDDMIEQQKKLPEEKVLEAGIQCAKGLRAAYSKGLIHRDVKPANILFGEEHTAKIGDFGLAGVAAETGESRGEIWGTPYYVAPERLNNQPEDFRSDIYSLGATLFHAITGHAPIEGDTNSATALRDLKNSPPKLREVAPEISEKTADVLQRMIAPDPIKRFPSYDALVSELEQAYGALTGKGPGAPVKKAPVLLAVIAVVVALAIAIGAILFVRNAKKAGPVTVLVPASSTLTAGGIAELERQLGEARRQLGANHYNVAGAQFAKIAAEARGKQPLYNWTRMQQGLASMVGRETSQARQAFQEVENAGQTGFNKENAELGKFFVATAKRLLAQGVVPASEAAQLNATNHESFAALLYGMKDIEQGDANNAVPLLEQFINSKPAGNVAWLSELKTVGQKYLDDAKAYLAWKNQPGSEATAAEAADKLNRVRDLKKRLKARSAFSDDVNAQERILGSRVGDQRRNEDVAKAQERKKLLDTELPAWNAALANYRNLVRVYEFAAARDALAGAKASEPGLKETQAAMQKRAQWLVDWKTKLIEDINRQHYAGVITDLAGAQYSGIDAATPKNLSIKIGPYGSAQIVWTKLAPKTLLAVSNSFAKPAVPDVADRHWLSAVFAAEMGLADAKELAESAAKAKPEYREQVAPLLAPAPTPR